MGHTAPSQVHLEPALRNDHEERKNRYVAKRTPQAMKSHDSRAWEGDLNIVLGLSRFSQEEARTEGNFERRMSRRPTEKEDKNEGTSHTWENHRTSCSASLEKSVRVVSSRSTASRSTEGNTRRNNLEKSPGLPRRPDEGSVAVQPTCVNIRVFHRPNPSTTIGDRAANPV